MAYENLDTNRFDEVIGSDDIVLVDFWATWCGPCIAFAPVFEAASDTHTDITFAKVDVDAEAELATRLSIQSIPTLMAFRGGEVVHVHTGAVGAAALEQIIETIRNT